MGEVHKSYKIAASLDKVWDALVNPETIEMWGGGPAEMTEKEGENFSMWGGDVFGTNVAVIKNKKLVQDWYGGEWDRASKVEFDLTEKDGQVMLAMNQTNVPDSEVKDIDSGWDEYFLQPIKDLLES